MVNNEEKIKVLETENKRIKCENEALKEQLANNDALKNTLEKLILEYYTEMIGLKHSKAKYDGILNTLQEYTAKIIELSK